MAKRPKCPLCGLELEQYVADTLGLSDAVTQAEAILANKTLPIADAVTLALQVLTDKQVRVEKHVAYWMHNPRNLHEDILVTAHQDCFDKVKKAYPNFANPAETDWKAPTFPSIKDGKISLKTLSEFTSSEVL